MKEITSMILAFGLICSASVIKAEEGDSFTGQIGLGAIVFDSSNNLNPNSSEARLNDLGSSAEGESSVKPLLRLNAAWDVGDKGGLKMFFSTTPPVDEAGSFAVDFGTSYTISNIGILRGDFFFSPFEETWEDPYLVGVNREETDTKKFGGKVGLNRIMGSGLRVELVYMIDDVDNDLIGNRIPELERDGAIYALNMNYSFYPADNLEVRPRVSVRHGEYDGEANSFIKYKVQLEARYTISKFMIIPRAFLSYSEYDQVNPLFGETREDDGYGCSLTANYMAPFNLVNWSVAGRVSISEGNSNIDFYDTEAFSAATFVSYHF